MSARDIVLENLKGFLGDPPDELAEDGRQIFILHYLEHFAGCSVADVRPLRRDGLGIRIIRDAGRLSRLLEAAETEPIAYDACSELVMHASYHEIPLPEDLAWFAHEVMCGKKTRPRKRGQEPSKNVWRNTRIIFAVHHALREDPSLHATRNEATNAESACDIVAECLQEIGFNLKYKTVADIWRRRVW